MKIKLLLPASLVALATIAQAQDSPPKSGATNAAPKSNVVTSAKTRTEWNTNPAYWERVLVQKREAPEVQIGKSGWVIKGPIPEGIRRQRSAGDRSAGQRLLGLPVVRLLVPQPMALPPGGGQYFQWGESDRPWIAIAGGAAPGSASSNPLTHEARTSLVSIGR